MIQWDDLADAEKEKMTQVANGMAAATGSSTAGYLGELLDVINAEIAHATRIPAHLFEPTEKAESKTSLRHKWR